MQAAVFTRVRNNLLSQLDVVVPYLMRNNPDLDEESVFSYIKGKTGLSRLNSEDVQTIRALVLRGKLSAR